MAVLSSLPWRIELIRVQTPPPPRRRLRRSVENHGEGSGSGTHGRNDDPVVPEPTYCVVKDPALKDANTAYLGRAGRPLGLHCSHLGCRGQGEQGVQIRSSHVHGDGEWSSLLRNLQDRSRSGRWSRLPGPTPFTVSSFPVTFAVATSGASETAP